jgi:hypothetical protein
MLLARTMPATRYRLAEPLVFRNKLGDYPVIIASTAVQHWHSTALLIWTRFGRTMARRPKAARGFVKIALHDRQAIA